MNARDRTAAWLVSLSLAFSVFAIGGAPRWAALGASALGVASALPYLTGRRALGWRSPLVALLLAALALCVVQVIPLPAAAVGLLSPLRLEHAYDTARALGLDRPGWVALSASPPTTLLEAAKVAGYTGIAIACGRLGARRRNGELVVVAIAGVALAAAAVSWIHEAASITRFLGVYVAEHGTSSPLRTPFVNPNHFASLLALTAPMSVGAALRANDVRARWAWAAAAVLLVSTSLAIASRGGTIALVLGLVAFAGLALRTSRSAGQPRLGPQAILALAIGVVGAAGLLWGMFGARVATDLAATSAGELVDANSKFGAWQSTLPLVSDYLWTGVGRGAFETVFPPYHAPSGLRTYAFVENGPLQVLVDVGLPGALLLAAFGAAVARRAWSESAASPVLAGALAGTVAVVLHNLVDFGLQFPGVAVPAVAALGALMRPRVVATRQPRARRIAVRAAALGAGALIIAAAFWSPGLYDDRESLRARLAAAPAADAAATALARHVSRHPCDYLAYGVTAQRLIQLRSATAAPILNRALALHPTHPALRRAEGDLLYAAGYREQAAAAYARSLELEYRPKLMAAAIDRFPSDDLLRRALPRGGAAEKVIASLLSHKRAAVANDYATSVLAQGAPSATLLEQAGAAALAVGEDALGIERLDQAFALAPTASLAARLGRALLEIEEWDRAWDVAQSGITTGQPNAPQRVSLRWLSARAAAQAGDTERARAELEAAIDEADSNSLRSRARARLADYEASLGNDHAAEFQRSKIRQAEARNPL